MERLCEMVPWRSVWGMWLGAFLTRPATPSRWKSLLLTMAATLGTVLIIYLFTWKDAATPSLGDRLAFPLVTGFVALLLCQFVHFEKAMNRFMGVQPKKPPEK
jgi:hypothetical protein